MLLVVNKAEAGESETKDVPAGWLAGSGGWRPRRPKKHSTIPIAVLRRGNSIAFINNPMCFRVSLYSKITDASIVVIGLPMLPPRRALHLQ